MSRVRICHTCEEFVRIIHTCKEFARILHMCNKYVRMFHTCNRFVRLSNSSEPVTRVKNSHELFICVTNTFKFFTRLNFDICEEFIPIKISNWSYIYVTHAKMLYVRQKHDVFVRILHMHVTHMKCEK